MNDAVLYHPKMFSRTLVHECKCLLYTNASSLSLYQVTVILITQPPDHVSGVGLAELPLIAQTYFCDSCAPLRFQLRDLPLQPICFTPAHHFTPAHQIFGPLCSCSAPVFQAANWKKFTDFSFNVTYRLGPMGKFHNFANKLSQQLHHYQQHCTQCKARYLIYSDVDFDIFLRGETLHRWGWNLAWRRKGLLLHVKFHPHQCNDKGIGLPKLKFLLRSDHNVEYKRPTEAYPLHSFHKICRVCTPFQDDLAVKISLDLLKGLWGF